jgi:DNA-binding transcriptional regulator YiaG
MVTRDFTASELKLRSIQRLIDDFDQFISEMPARFDKKLFHRIRNQSLSQFEWSYYAQVSQGTIGNWERGITSPSGSYRYLLKDAAQRIRDELKQYWAQEIGGQKSFFDPLATSDQLRKSILKAAITDFEFNQENQQIVPIPFLSDHSVSNIDEIEKDKENLLSSLASQADALIEEISSGLNVPTDKIRRYLERYKAEASGDVPNPRLLNRFGQIVVRASNEADFSLGISSTDIDAFQGFAKDHMELMRLYFREALARSQEIEASDISSETQIDDGTQFKEIANLMEEAQSETGLKLISEDIPTILRDISTEMKDITEAINFSVDERRNEALRRRRAQAFKTGSVYVGRFVFFTALISVVLDAGTLGIAGSIASILGVVEIASPGTIRAKYEMLREKFPVLPPLPEIDAKKK